MQDDIEHRAVTLVVSTGKMTARTLKSAISKYLAHRKQKARDSPSGKQSIKKLIGQGQGVSNIEITDHNIKSFERIARKYGVDYALKKDTSGDKPKYLVFFKAKDASALTAAFQEYTAKDAKREEKRPSLLAQLRKLKAAVRAAPQKEKRKEHER